MSRFVLSEQDVAAEQVPGDTTETRVVFGRVNGSERLEQRVIRFGPGRSNPRTLNGRQEVLYVVSGEGTLRLEGTDHALTPNSGAFLAAGETYHVENGGVEPLTVVSVLALQLSEPGPKRRVAVRFDDRTEIQADERRSFRYLVHEDTGCLEVTQFVGIVKPGRAPDHSHPYDEVGYIVEGYGVAHVGSESTPIGPGSCFHLPPGEVHCIESTGPGVMRILGVFYPSGSPGQRSYAAGGNN